MWCVFICGFFFFKQKTAYEMRISDWSSDVCSSDLRGQVVLLTFDPSHRGFWLADYIPALVALDDVQMPRMTDYEKWLGPVEISAVPIPHDCTDGFLYAYWRRPAAYLDPRIREIGRAHV